MARRTSMSDWFVLNRVLSGTATAKDRPPLERTPAPRWGVEQALGWPLPYKRLTEATTALP